MDGGLEVCVASGRSEAGMGPVDAKMPVYLATVGRHWIEVEMRCSAAYAPGVSTAALVAEW